MDYEIKTALQIKIFGREEKGGTTYYVIRTWLVYSPGEISQAYRKRYNNFIELNETLMRYGYQNLPVLPQKQLFMTDSKHEERQRGLENYLKELINRKDTRNS